MTDCVFPDVSSYQCGVDDSFNKQFFAFRSSDGTYQDSNFAHNYNWAVKAANSGKIAGFIVYYVWEDSNSYKTLESMVKAQGGPHAKMAVMQDIESWGGKLSGNHSSAIGDSRESLIKWLGNNRKRVINYANQGDRSNLCPSWGDAKWIIANYSNNPNLTDQIAHQYADDVSCPPFGKCDSNSADGYSPSQFAAALGLSGSTPDPTPEDDDMPKQLYLYTKSGQTTTLKTAGTWYCLNWDADLDYTGGNGLSLPKDTSLFSLSAWLYTTGMGLDDDLYWRVQTLKQSDNSELAKFPVGEIRATGGGTDLQFGMVGSVSKSTPTNLRILVSSTKAGVVVSNAWWRTFVW